MTAMSATWVPDPKGRITAMTTSFRAYVTESTCMRGASSEDRLRPPLIDYEADRVVIAYTVEPLEEVGDSTCIGNPPTELMIELSEPLGERDLVDGGLLPWRDVRSLD
jgi:hypothetical protein